MTLLPKLTLAKHITIDFYMNNISILSHKEKLENIMKESAKISWATIISSDFHSFSPIWVSWVIILAESHFTIHTWPEHNYVAIDMFACGSISFQKAISYIQEKLWSQKINIISNIDRGIAWNISQIQKKLPEIKNPSTNWEKQYKDSNPWWIHCWVDVYNCNPKSLRDADFIKKYVKELVKLIDMKTFWETQVVHFWEDERVAGFSMTQLIETSLISWHFANDSNAIYIDIFSCKYYNPNVVARFTTEFFEWERYELSINLRM